MANRAKARAKFLAVILFDIMLIVGLAGAWLYIYEPFDAQTNSMTPTINEGDHFLVSKRAYDFAAPQLGDVILFEIPSWDLWSVARVVGLPGHRVQMIGSSLTINGQYIGRAGRDPDYTETLPNGVKYDVRAPFRGRNDSWTPQYLVPDGHYFVLGDNRDHSIDSRDMEHVGFIAKEDILGKVQWRFWDGTRQQLDASVVK
jgi:signal peptidase I